nr:restriction endonuclease subunit S [Chengkuizengella sediminis]
MFPKEGESVPEVRFPGFTGEWEERKFFDNIKNIIDFRGRTPKKLGFEWSESGYLALSALNVKNGYIDPSADAHYGDEELYQKWMGGRELKQGQVLFTTEAPMGNVAQVPDNKGYILSQRTIAFDVDENKITNNFLRVLLCSPKVFNELSSLSSGGTAKGVSQKSLSQLKVQVPKSLEEQIKIGNFFEKMEETITLHQRELDALKETKKAFLQKLFA